jgi:nucleoid DNA-binding protein
MRTISRLELSKDIADRRNLSVNTVREVLDEFILQMYGHYLKSQRVEMRGLGIFWTQTRKGRTVSVPGGSKVVVEDKVVMKFKPSRILVKDVAQFSLAKETK